MNMLAKKAKKGFTIVELVIVIAVIAILAAVLIPTFAGVINAANESVMMQECRAEWSNFLPEVAANSDFQTTTYYVVYTDDDGTETVFEVSNGTFDAEPSETTTGSLSSYTKITEDNYTYDYLNENVSIYVPTSSKIGQKVTTSSEEEETEEEEEGGNTGGDDSDTTTETEEEEEGGNTGDDDSGNGGE